MRHKQDFILREVANTWVVIPLGKANLDFDGMLTLNETGATLWKLMENDISREELADALVVNYDVSKVEALRDVDDFLNTLRVAKSIEE